MSQKVNASELNKYFSKTPGKVDGTKVSPFSLDLGNYAITTGMLKALNWPKDDATNFNGSLFIFGSYNDPSNNKGYRVYLFATNKSEMWYATEWWGNNPVWQKITATPVS